MKKGIIIVLGLVLAVALLASCGLKSPVGQSYELTEKSYTELIKATAKASGRSEASIKSMFTYEDLFDEYGYVFTFEESELIITDGKYSEHEDYTIDSDRKVYLDGEEIGYFDKKYSTFYAEIDDLQGVPLNFYLKKQSKSASPAGKSYELTKQSYNEFVKAAAKGWEESEAEVKDDYPSVEDLGYEYWSLFEFTANTVIFTDSDGYCDYENYMITSDGKVMVDGEEIGYFDKKLSTFYYEDDDFDGEFTLNFYLKKDKKSTGPAWQSYQLTQESYDEFVKAAAKAWGESEADIRSWYSLKKVGYYYGRTIEFTADKVIVTYSDGDTEVEEYKISSDGKVMVEGDKIGYFDKNYSTFYLEDSDFEGKFTLSFNLKK